MERFSMRCMRRESARVLRLPLICFVASMLCSAFLGAVLKSKHAASSWLTAGICIPGVFALLCLGTYLIVSDEKRLIRTTVYGKMLTALGNPEQLMQAIDAEARVRCERYSRFTLLNTWLIVMEWEGKQPSPQSGKVCFRPIPRSSIRSVYRLPSDLPERSNVRRLMIECENAAYTVPCYYEQEVDALRDWMKEHE